MLGSMVGMIGRMVRRTGQSVLGRVLGWVTGHGGTVLLDAATDARAPEVTFSRADQAMVCDEAGNWTWTALPYRRSYDVQTKEWGYLLEPQRTNLVPTSTATAAQTLAVTAQTYTVSFIGTGSIALSGASTATVPASTTRATLTFTPTAGNLTITPTGDVRFLQLETGTVATSPIATSGAAKTVAADVCRVPNTTLGLSDSGFTILARVAHLRNEAVAVSVQGSSTGRLIGRTGSGRHYMANTGAKVVNVGDPQLGAPYTTVSSCSPVELTLRDSGSENRVNAPPGYGLTSESIFNVGFNEMGTDRMVGYINHLSVFPTQLDAATRAEAVQLFN